MTWLDLSNAGALPAALAAAVAAGGITSANQERAAAAVPTNEAVMDEEDEGDGQGAAEDNAASLDAGYDSGRSRLLGDDGLTEALSASQQLDAVKFLMYARAPSAAALLALCPNVSHCT